LESYI